MKQHPIPQNILDIEFKLFSKFTVREFIYIASGIGIGGIFLFALAGEDLPPIIAVPLFLISSGLGLFLGIAKINDQKAEVYLKNFILSINTPTLRVWRSKFYKEKSTALLQNEKQVPKTPIQDKVIGSSPSSTLPISDFSSQGFDNEELTRLQNIESLLKNSNQKEKLENNNPVLDTKDTDFANNLPQISITPNENINPIASSPTTQTIPTIQTSNPSPHNVNLTENTIIDINENNLVNFQIDNSIPINLRNSINLKLIDKNNNPIPNALAIIKDSTNNIIQAKVSDKNGLLITNKEYGAGTYKIYIQSKEYRFPLVNFSIMNNIYPIIIIKEI